MLIVGTSGWRRRGPGARPAWPPRLGRAGPALVPPVLGPPGPGPAVLLLVPPQLVEGGEQGPGLPVTQPEVPAAAPGRGLELDPRLSDPVRLGRLLADRPPAGPDPGQGRGEHRGDLLAALDRLDVPGERDQVTPEA